MFSDKLSLKVLTAFACALAVALGALSPLPAVVRAQQGRADPAAVDAFLVAARQDVEKNMAKDPALKKLAAKYPLVLLASREWFGGAKCAFSFIDGTNDDVKQRKGVQLMFHNGGYEKSFDINLEVGQSNLVADLGNVDFTKDPDPKAVDIDGEGQHTWMPDGQAEEGDVYLERVRDREGNHFYVLFKVVALEKDSRYIAFLWRKLPGGKVVKDDPKIPVKDK